MRELKFRAWTNNSWINECMIYDYQNTTHIESIGFNCEELPLMQYTGLNDKNDKEIYEGDILKVGSKHCFNSDLLNEFKELNNLDTINEIGLHFTGIVRIDLLRGLMFENIENGYKEPMFTRNINIKMCHSYIEVIGNIYETPELLK